MFEQPGVNTSNILEPPPRRINTVIAKVAKGCPLACDGCYVYEPGTDDERWRTESLFMSDETIELLGRRTAEYVTGSDNLDKAGPETTAPASFRYIWHGGEPGLVKAETYARWLSLLRNIVGPNTVPEHRIQTAGTTLTDDHMAVFKEHGMRVGVSLNGSKKTNDLVRLDHARRSTYDKAVAGIRLMTDNPKYSDLFGGILATIDLRSDPAETYNSLADLLPPSIDFLLPHRNRANPLGYMPSDVSYGKWLADLFDAWGNFFSLRIPFFDTIIAAYSGDPSRIETIGTPYNDRLMVVSTDGGYEGVDVLSTIPGNVGITELNVKDHSMREAEIELYRSAAAMGATALCTTCQGCPVVSICGGGYMPHRYDVKSLFANPSIYCKDLAFIISHIGNWLGKSKSYPEVLEHLTRTAAQSGRPTAKHQA